VQFVERLLAGAIGAASARVMLASVIKGEDISPEGIVEILDETSQVLEYSRQLEQKSQALEKASVELKAANQQLKQLDRLKDEFLSTVTHELRTPLTSIRSFSEILFDNPELEIDRQQNFLAIIISESERLTRLINQVLDIAKIEAGRMEWVTGRIDMNQVIEGAVATIRHLFEEKNIDLKVRLADNSPVVQGDRDRLMQVVINLLSNAEKFCRPVGGKVAVTLSMGEAGLIVGVSDNGRGINQEDQQHLFEKFHQISDQATGNPMGSGLGLAISKLIVEHAGGRIWVDSESGKGATFYFSIPYST